MSAYAGKRACESERAHEYVRECLYKRIRVYMFKYICMVGRRALPVQYNVAATHLARPSRDNRRASNRKKIPATTIGRAGICDAENRLGSDYFTGLSFIAKPPPLAILTLIFCLLVALLFTTRKSCAIVLALKPSTNCVSW